MFYISVETRERGSSLTPIFPYEKLDKLRYKVFNAEYLFRSACVLRRDSDREQQRTAVALPPAQTMTSQLWRMMAKFSNIKTVL